MKDRNELLKRKINGYLKKEQFFKNDEHKKQEKPFIAKSRKNFTVAKLLFKISEEEDMRRILNLASGFEMDDWAIIVSYYSMYTSSLSALKLRLNALAGPANIKSIITAEVNTAVTVFALFII